MVDLSKFASNKKILSNIISLSYKQFWNQTLTFVYIYIYIYICGGAKTWAFASGLSPTFY